MLKSGLLGAGEDSEGGSRAEGSRAKGLKPWNSFCTPHAGQAGAVQGPSVGSLFVSH